MLQTFSYRTETKTGNYYQTVYAENIESSIAIWLEKIEDLKEQEYSFNEHQVKIIKEQYSQGKLMIQTEQEPFHLVYNQNDQFQFVYITNLNSEVDFVAEVNYLSKDEGGRQSYVMSGYRGQVKFNGKDGQTSGEQVFRNNDTVYPGESAIAEIRILGVEYFANQLFEGLEFEILEGSRIVGKGKIIDLLNEKLKKACH